MNHFAWITALAAICPMVFLSGCRDRKAVEDAVAQRPQVTGVTVGTAALSQADEFIETPGTVKARTVSAVASRVMGTVTSMQVKEGDKVQAGQLLATLDDRDVVQKVSAGEKAVEAAQQQKSLADITYRRYRRLYDDGALTGQELDQAETQKKVADLEYERAQAMLREARVYEGFTRVVAPFSGVVIAKKTELGSMAVPGEPLFTLEDTAGYRIEVSLDEKYAGVVKKGVQAMIMGDSLQHGTTGSITEIVPSVDSATRTFLVKIAVSAEGLRNGAYCRVLIPAGRKEKLLVDKDAIVSRGQLTGVYAVDRASIISYRLVRTGRTYDGRVEVLSGLSPGETIIVGGTDRAVDGGVIVAK